jgi:putative ABC transport system permease protein
MNSVYLPGGTTPVEIGIYPVQASFFRAMGMKLLAGRDFDENRPRDDSTRPFPINMDAERALVIRGTNAIVSDSAAKRLGFRTPAAAIGQTVKGSFSAIDNALVPATIVGVVQDARFRSMHDPLQPIMFLMTKQGFTHVDIRFAGIAPNQLRQEVQGVWDRLLPQVPFQGDFADDLLREEYKADIARGQLFAGFALLSVVVGCLGLFGLASFTAERRTKEIGIRKVLGARTRDIVRLLVWQFSRPVLIANMIAWPIAWWGMRDWLDKFDQRVPLGPAPFLFAGGVALGIAIATIASHAFRVARANPILALRYE